MNLRQLCRVIPFSTAALALALSCSLATAASSEPARVYLNAPSASPERPAKVPNYQVVRTDAREPTKFLSVQAFLSGVEWSTWGGSTATGTGRVEVDSDDTRPGHHQAYASQSAAVSITTSGLVSCGGQLVYTAYALSLASGAAEPQDFSYVKIRSLPCRLHALAYYAGIEKVAHTTGDCLFRGVSGQLPSGFGYFAYCRMQWKDWGGPTTVGTGVGRGVALPSGCDGIRGEECDYGIRVSLSKPAWCSAEGMSYTRERLEVFGKGILLSSEPQTRNGVVDPSVVRRLRAAIGKTRPSRVAYDRARPSQHCVPTA